MPKDILYSLAKNESGDFVNAVAAKRGGIYFCPSCQKQMIHRMGERVRPHFAHKNLTNDCSPETVLHFGFKRLLFKRLSRALSTGERVSIQWNCDSCCGSHMGNLLKRATHAEEELHLGSCRPDIALLDKGGNVVAAIEIVVSHSPEQSTLEYYKSKGIPLIVFKLRTDAELSRVGEEVLIPDSVNACTKCWKCNSPMKVGALVGDAGCECEFTADHIALAKRNGANIKTIYSKTVKARYAANTCRKCNAFIGRHFLFLDYVSVEEYPSIELDAGFYCPLCVQTGKG